MNDKMVEYIRGQAQNEKWAYLMKELFPWMMSFTPGGINYDLNQPVELRAIAWVDAHRKLVLECYDLGVNYIGLNRQMNDNPVNRALELSVSGNLRKLRNEWKKVMQVLSWDHSDPLWRRPDGRDSEVWAQEWRIIRAELKKLYPDHYNEVLDNA